MCSLRHTTRVKIANIGHSLWRSNAAPFVWSLLTAGFGVIAWIRVDSPFLHVTLVVMAVGIVIANTVLILAARQKRHDRA